MQAKASKKKFLVVTGLVLLFLLYEKQESFSPMRNLSVISTIQADEVFPPSFYINGYFDYSAEWICKYDPKDTTACNDMLAKRLPAPVINPHSSDHSFSRRRVLLFGDSTMHLLYHGSKLQQRLDPFNNKSFPKDLVCGKIRDPIPRHDPCQHMQREFGFKIPQGNQYQAPNFAAMEGPYDKPFCDTCSTCSSSLHFCLKPQIETQNIQVQTMDQDRVRGLSPTRQMYGGYIAQSFMKDVMLQTSKFRYTQQTIADWIDTNYNNPALVDEWGKPICIVRVGNHDLNTYLRYMDRIGSFEEAFKSNLSFFIQSYSSSCSHIVFLSLTGNANEYSEKYLEIFHNHLPAHRMKPLAEINNWMKEVMPTFGDLVSYVDVFESSLFATHQDFLHMGQEWRNDLSSWFLEVLER